MQIYCSVLNVINGTALGMNYWKAKMSSSVSFDNDIGTPRNSIGILIDNNPNYYGTSM